MEKVFGTSFASVEEGRGSSQDGSIGTIEGTVHDVEDMKRMGKEQLFKRNFSFFSILGFGMIIMNTWESYLGTVAFGLANGGTAGMIYMYIAVCILFSLTNVSMSEMASMAPTAGGQYHWVSEFAPRRYQKQLSFFVGWLCVLGWQTGVSIGCFQAATDIQGLVVLNYPEYVYERWHGSLLTIAVVLLAALFNTFGARLLPMVEGVILFLHITGFLAIVITLWVVTPDRTPSDAVWTSFVDEFSWNNIGLACLVGMLSPINSLLGADATTHMSEELRNAAKSLPKAMIATSVFNSLLGLVMVVTFCYNVGDVNSVLGTKTGFPFIQTFFNSTGSLAATNVLTAIIIVLAFSCGMTNLATASRQLFAFARDKGVPFHSWFMHVPKGWNIPINAICFTTLFSCLLPLINIGSVIAFEQIISLGVCALLSSYIISISCVCARRLSGSHLLSSPFSLGRWGLVINVASILWLVLGLVMTFFPPSPNPAPDAMNWAVVVYAGVLAIAAFYYTFWARHVYVGPVEYVRKSV